MQEEIICPYPGLRPFNEDEAIFFKGRDEHIEQITRQLEEKKFLMLTGASGDGKSSLVYAGLIPNARAGFFKAKFNNWIVVDFRPERSPLTNLADALQSKFSASEKDRFQNELKFGFSALIDIYTQSQYYIDKNTPEFLALDDAEKKKAIRKGANLMILVDQFEEFFTNTENYSNGKTSVDSQLVVNLILETSKIALEKDIPIYVICTMRSDYIGQCASFRGLPEAIGFSQFFVPRLKRNEIYQVIQEPAELNGNKISKRLVEVLINEMNDGIDQLPVLQHALNQIWQMAKKGQEEMDLIHFAKIGGLVKNYLPKSDQPVFDQWLETVPDYKKPFFGSPSLDNVLDSHANELYYKAYDYFKSKNPTSNLTIIDSKQIIEVAFKCLTKIDQSRGVRNRMTLKEIVNIIDKTHIGENEVAGILEVFRLQGNTFLKPFYQENQNDNQLKSDSVLDITHESLIRNWSNLISWAKEEDEDYHIWLDFEKQLSRWIENEKSNGYLLPIGPLNFFETWFVKKKPNKYWLVKYDDSDDTSEQKLIKAESILKNAKQFIAKSARKLFVSRTILKYGAQKLALIISSIVVLISCIFLYFDYNEKKNEQVFNYAEEKGITLLSNSKVKASIKAQFLLLYENNHPGTITDNIALCGNDSVQIRVAFEIFSIFKDKVSYFNQDLKTLIEVSKLKISIADYLAKSIIGKHKNKNEMITYSEACRLFWLSKTLAYANFSMADSTYSDHISNQINSIHSALFDNYIHKIINSHQKIENVELFNAIVYYFMANQFDHKKLSAITEKISPFNSDSSNAFYKRSFARNQILSKNDFTLKYNGGYELLSCLYAYLGNEELVNRSIDSISKYDPKFYSRYNFGYIAIANCHWLGETDTSHSFIENLASRKSKLSEIDLETEVGLMSIESQYPWLWTNANEIFLNKGIMYFNDFGYFTFYHCNKDILNWYQNRIWKLNLSPDEIHYTQANIYKYRAQSASIIGDTAQKMHFLNKFITMAEQLDIGFLNDSIVLGTGMDKIKTSRKTYLFYPSYVNKNYSWEFENNWINGTINGILTFYAKKDILNKFKFTDSETNKIIAVVFNELDNLPITYINPFDLNRSNEFYNFLNYAQNHIKDPDKKNTAEIFIELMGQIDLDSLFENTQLKPINEKLVSKITEKEFYTGEENIVLTRINIFKIYLFDMIKNGKLDDVIKYFGYIEKPHLKNNLILDLCNLSLDANLDAEAIKLLSIYVKESNLNKKVPSMYFLIAGKIGGEGLLEDSYSLLREADENIKTKYIKLLIRGMALKLEYWNAIRLIPPSISSSSELIYFNEILAANFIHNASAAEIQNKSWISDVSKGSDMMYETAANRNYCYCEGDE